MATAAPDSSVLRLQHVSLPIPARDGSLVASRRFYGQLLGLEERPRPPGLPNAGLWYAVGDQELHLYEEPSGAAVNSESKRHPCFQVEDVEALRAHLSAAGVTTMDDDGEIPGRPRFFAIDPFDNTLEFVTFETNHW
jgi:catechol 2,3-dioxygenase-like lactoylglutathione lyase family enzyme